MGLGAIWWTNVLNFALPPQTLSATQMVFLKLGRLQQPDQWNIQIGNVALALGARGDLHRSIPEIKKDVQLTQSGLLISYSILLPDDRV